jgi:hypothetical protein
MGTLYVAKGTWRDDEGRELPDPPPIRVGAPSQGVVVNPEGEQVPQTPLQPPAEPPPIELDASADASPPPEDAGIVMDGGAGVPDVIDLPPDATPLEADTRIRR